MVLYRGGMSARSSKTRMMVIAAAIIDHTPGAATF